MKQPASEKSQVAEITFITDNDIDHEESTLFSELINWQPLYNLYTTPDGIMVHLELPGVNEGNITVYLRRRYMIVTGSRVTPPGLTGECCVFHNLEIPYGSFTRRIDFPITIETQQYSYDLQAGILTMQFQALKEKIIPIEGE
jgi:HSP20 family molecular chaperone IbpA